MEHGLGRLGSTLGDVPQPDGSGTHATACRPGVQSVPATRLHGSPVRTERSGLGAWERSDAALGSGEMTHRPAPQGATVPAPSAARTSGPNGWSGGVVR